MKSKIMISYFIIKLLTAFSFPLFLIVTFDVTHSPFFIGIVSFLIAFGNITGNVYWQIIAEKRRIFLLSYFSFASLMLLLSNSIWLISLAAYTFSFFNSIAYISLLISSSSKKGLQKRLANLEEWGGIGYLLGLGLGMLSKMLPLNFIVFLVQVFSIVAIFLLYKTIRVEFIKSMKKPRKIIMDYKNYFYFYFGSLIKGFTTISTRIFQLSRPKALKLHIPYILFFLSAGMIVPQIVSVIKASSLGDSVVYFSYLVGSSFAILGYKYMKKSPNVNKAAIVSLAIRVILFISFSLLIFLRGLELLLGVIIFKIIQGVTWGILLVWFNFTIIEKAKEELGANLAIRSFSSSIGNLLGGVIFEFNSFLLGPISAMILLFSVVNFLRHL